MHLPGPAATRDWRSRLPDGVRPYVESAPLAAAFLGISSGFAFAMIGATLTTRLAQYGIRKSAVTAFALTFLAYNFKWLWAPFVDTIRIPILGRFGQRRSWLWLVGLLVMAAVTFLGATDPATSLPTVAAAAVLVGDCRRDLRHRHRRVPHRAARAAAAGRRLGHVAIRLADRRRVGGRGGAGGRGARMAGRWRMRRARCSRCRRCSSASSWASRSAAARRRRPRVSSAVVALFQPPRRVPAASGCAGGPALRAHPQDWRHARQPDAAAAVRGPRLQQRRNRVLRRRRRLHRAADGRVRRRGDVRHAWA